MIYGNTADSFLKSVIPYAHSREQYVLSGGMPSRLLPQLLQFITKVLPDDIIR